jgi:predicted AAA+ superfamily ATPase
MPVVRLLHDPARALFAKYPVLTITGPRQAGKTTLCRDAFPDLAYVNLESPDRREFASGDPRGFLREVADGAILDEIQRAPELVSYIQEHVDEKRRNGLFVLTGSQQFRVTEAISQSLAGRTAILRLLPFTIAEAAALRTDLDADGMLYTGFYPRIYDQTLDPTQALGDYFETYVERDVRQISEIRNLSGFRTFVKLCAGRVGQLLNLQGLGNDAGVSHTTAREWISVLEASYVVFLLPPLHANVSKRLIKASKLYFYDVGLAAYLLGIENEKQIFAHPLKGALFENLIVMEALKHRYNQGLRSNLRWGSRSRPARRSPEVSSTAWRGCPACGPGRSTGGCSSTPEPTSSCAGAWRSPIRVVSSRPCRASRRAWRRAPDSNRGLSGVSAPPAPRATRPALPRPAPPAHPKWTPGGYGSRPLGSIDSRSLGDAPWRRCRGRGRPASLRTQRPRRAPGRRRRS